MAARPTRVLERLAGVLLAHRLQHAVVGMREGVGPGQSTHGDVLRCPFADTRQAPQPVQRRFHFGARFESQSSCGHRRASDHDGVGARRYHTDFPELRGLQRCHALGRRKQPAQRRTPALAIGSPNAAAKRPASVRAAFTVICCPRIARTASSKPSKAPGNLSPGCCAASGPSASAMSAGRRTDRTTASRAPAPPERLRRATRTLQLDRRFAPGRPGHDPAGYGAFRLAARGPYADTARPRLVPRPRSLVASRNDSSASHSSGGR